MIVPSLKSEDQSLREKRSLHSPARRLLPDLHLGKKFTLSLLNLAHVLQCRLRSHNLSALDWPSVLLVSLSATLFRLMLSPLHPQPSSQPGVSSFSRSLSQHNPAPAKWFIGTSCTLFPTLEKNGSVLLPVRLQFLWNVCDDLFWLTIPEKDLLSETPSVVFYKSALLLFAPFPKGQLSTCLQRFESYHRWI